jgi:hypothetical protein
MDNPNSILVAAGLHRIIEDLTALTTPVSTTMPSLPSPRYREVGADRGATKHTSIATSEQKKPLLGHEDEEKAWAAWSDSSASDPIMVGGVSQRRQRLWSAVMSIRSLLDTVLLFVIVGLLLERDWQRPGWFEIGGDITGFAPRSKPGILTIRQNDECIIS